MSNEFNLTVDKRELSNKGGRKRALKEGKIPGIYYSHDCLLYTSPSPRDGLLSRMPSSA